MSTSLELVQMSPVAINPQVSIAEQQKATKVIMSSSSYREKLWSVIGAWATSLDHSPSTIDHKFSQILKINSPRMEESEARINYLNIGVRKAMSTLLKLLSKEQIDRRAIHAAAQHGISAIEQYKEFLHQTIEFLPSKKQELFTHLQPQIEETLNFFESFIRSIAPSILINPSLMARFRSAQPVILHTLDHMLTILKKQREVLITSFVHSLAPIAHHEFLLRRIIHSTRKDALPSLTLTIKLLKKEDPKFAHMYTALEHMIAEKHPLETIISYSKQLQMHVHSKIVHLWKKLESRLQALE